MSTKPVAVVVKVVGVRNTRYTVTAGLLSELAAVIAGVFIARIFFPAL